MISRGTTFFLRLRGSGITLGQTNKLEQLVQRLNKFRRKIKIHSRPDCVEITWPKSIGSLGLYRRPEIQEIKAAVWFGTLAA